MIKSHVYTGLSPKAVKWVRWLLVVVETAQIAICLILTDVILPPIAENFDAANRAASILELDKMESARAEVLRLSPIRTWVVVGSMALNLVSFWVIFQRISDLGFYGLLYPKYYLINLISMVGCFVIGIQIIAFNETFALETKSPFIDEFLGKWFTFFLAMKVFVVIFVYLKRFKTFADLFDSVEKSLVLVKQILSMYGV